MIDYNVENYFIRPGSTLLEAMEVISENRRRIGFLCENNNVLKAVVSDGDIRRALIKTYSLESSVDIAANYRPRYVFIGENQKGERMLSQYDCCAIPVVDAQMHIVGVIVKDTYFEEPQKQLVHLPVVIMAGGEGSRLRPYTNVLPKPLIPIGNKTILERIIDKFVSQGCDDFTLIINYKKELIRAYFNSYETPPPYKIDFCEENEFLGTGGGLKLVSDRIKETFLVSNCDVLVDCDYSELLARHKAENNVLTVVCADMKMTIPYGVIECGTNHEILAIKEKPDYHALISTGVYVVEPEFLDMIPPNTFIHITDLMEKCIAAGKRVGTFVVNAEAWLDMGQFNEMRQMKEHFHKMG